MILEELKRKRKSKSLLEIRAEFEASRQIQRYQYHQPKYELRPGIKILDEDHACALAGMTIYYSDDDSSSDSEAEYEQEAENLEISRIVPEFFEGQPDASVTEIITPIQPEIVEYPEDVEQKTQANSEDSEPEPERTMHRKSSLFRIPLPRRSKRNRLAPVKPWVEKPKYDYDLSTGVGTLVGVNKLVERSESSTSSKTGKKKKDDELPARKSTRERKPPTRFSPADSKNIIKNLEIVEKFKQPQVEMKGKSTKNTRKSMINLRKSEKAKKKPVKTRKSSTKC